MYVETPLEAIPGLQLVTAGNRVWYVHQNPVRRPAPKSKPKAAVKVQQVNPVQGTPDWDLAEGVCLTQAAPPLYRQDPGIVRRWPAATAPPKGYGYEFGTGRLLPLDD